MLPSGAKTIIPHPPENRTTGPRHRSNLWLLVSLCFFHFVVVVVVVDVDVVVGGGVVAVVVAILLLLLDKRQDLRTFGED